MAKAEESTVLRVWQGLGYYSRARNLHATAKYISEQLGGNFPNTYSEILKLKGIGPYTAAAIASICFNEATPVVDGNVFRFASRLFGVTDDISKAKTRKIFEELLSEWISKEKPDLFNQAMMEFGATVCSPKPICQSCPFKNMCYALKENLIQDLPVKSGKVITKKRYINYLVIHSEDFIIMNERIEKDVWKGLYDFLIEEGELGEEKVLESLLKTGYNFTLENVSDTFKHILSHQVIFAKFYLIKMSEEDLNDFSIKSNGIVVRKEEVVNLPKPKLIVNYLNKSTI